MPKLGNRDTKKWKWWTRTLAKFEQSEMTLPEFCRINRITYATACEWRRKIGEDNAKSVESMPTPVRRRGRKPKVANDATPVCQSVEDKFVSVNVIDDELIPAVLEDMNCRSNYMPQRKVEIAANSEGFVVRVTRDTDYPTLVLVLRALRNTC